MDLLSGLVVTLLFWLCIEVNGDVPVILVNDEPYEIRASELQPENFNPINYPATLVQSFLQSPHLGNDHSLESARDTDAQGFDFNSSSSVQDFFRDLGLMDQEPESSRVSERDAEYSESSSYPNYQPAYSSGPGYGPPAQSYGQGYPNYGPSRPSYGPSKPGYGPSYPSYAPPHPSYGPSKPSYGQYPVSHNQGQSYYMPSKSAAISFSKKPPASLLKPDLLKKPIATKVAGKVSGLLGLVLSLFGGSTDGLHLGGGLKEIVINGIIKPLLVAKGGLKTIISKLAIPVIALLLINLEVLVTIWWLWEDCEKEKPYKTKYEHPPAYHVPKPDYGYSKPSYSYENPSMYNYNPY